MSESGAWQYFHDNLVRMLRCEPGAREVEQAVRDLLKERDDWKALALVRGGSDKERGT
jgi:hypothetical protein